MKYLSSFNIISIFVLISQISFAREILDGGSGGGGGGNALTSYRNQSSEAQNIDNSSKNNQLPKSSLIYLHSVKNNQIHFSIARHISQKWEIRKYQIDRTSQIDEKTLRSLDNSNSTNDWAEIK